MCNEIKYRLLLFVFLFFLFYPNEFALLPALYDDLHTPLWHPGNFW